MKDFEPEYPVKNQIDCSTCGNSMLDHTGEYSTFNCPPTGNSYRTFKENHYNIGLRCNNCENKTMFFISNGIPVSTYILKLGKRECKECHCISSFHK